MDTGYNERCKSIQFNHFHMKLPLVVFIGAVLVVGNDGSEYDDDDGSVVVGLVGNDGWSGCVDSTTEITKQVSQVNINISKF